MALPTPLHLGPLPTPPPSLSQTAMQPRMRSPRYQLLARLAQLQARNLPAVRLAAALRSMGQTPGELLE